MAAGVPWWVVGAALRVRSWLLALADRLVPPEVAVLDRVLGVSSTAGVGAAVRTGVVDALASADGTAEEVASRAGLPAETAGRLLRVMETVGVVVRTPGAGWRLTRLGRALAPGGGARAWAIVWSSPWMMAAWADLDASVRTGRDHFVRQHHASLWTYLDGHPDGLSAFSEAMNERTEAVADSVVAALDLRPGERVCDVGGGFGGIARAARRAHPDVTSVVLEAPSVVALGRARFGEEPRLTWHAATFDGDVPGGCDVYVLKNIVHDWGDARVAAILAAVVAAAPSGARVAVVETPLDDAVFGELAAQLDIGMLLLCEGKERTADALEDLLRGAGLRPVGRRRLAEALVVFTAVCP